jgi:hypothetical protein
VNTVIDGALPGGRRRRREQPSAAQLSDYLGDALDRWPGAFDNPGDRDKVAEIRHILNGVAGG